MRVRRRLNLERLEDRTTPATTGVTWPDGRHVTLSFVPDGTVIAGFQSNLFAKLNTVAPPAVWQREIARAFQTWAVHANLNVGVVADGGQPMGGAGAVQGDGRFGDIRIAAAPLPAGTLMTNTTFQWSGTTWSGDVVVNSAYAFSIGAQPGAYDLYTATLNEAGNVFGVLDTRKDKSSGVFHQYIGLKSNINANDIADIQSLYGIRAADHFETAGANDSFATATALPDNGPPLDPEADITTSDDADFFSLSIPLTVPLTIGFKVEVTTRGLSMLAPAVTVFDGAGDVVDADASTDPLHGMTTVQVNSVFAGQTYFIRVSAASAGAFAVGGYHLNVVYQRVGGLLTTLIGAVPSLVPDLNINDTIANAIDLTPTWTSKPDARFDAMGAGAIDAPGDVDYYRIRSPQTAAGPRKLNALVWAADGSPLIPKIELYDDNGQAVPMQVLANENGTFSIEASIAAPLATYYLKISALDPAGNNTTGKYRFGGNFSTSALTALVQHAQGLLSAASSAESWQLNVSRNSLTQFLLEAGATTGANSCDVQLVITNGSGAVVFTLVSKAGQYLSSGHVYLAAGSYLARITAVPQSGGTVPAVDYRLFGQLVSDPIGPQRDRGHGMTTPPPVGWDKVTQSPSTVEGWDDPYVF